MTTLNVIFTIDERFLQHFSVTLFSLLENNKDLRIRAFVIHNIEKEAALDRLRETADLVAEKYNASLEVVFFNDSVFDHYKVAPQFSKTVYYRLLITELVPQDIDKILFLDSDIVVTGSLKELATLEFKYLAAVQDFYGDTVADSLNALGFPVKKYFNAGVLLIDVKTWREENISAKLIELADEYMNRIAWWDQDILNMYFHDKWHVLPGKYNALFLNEKLPETPLIIHYGGTHKPWMYTHDHPYKSLYWKYIRLTPFKDARYPDYSPKEVMRKGYIRMLNLLGLRNAGKHKRPTEEPQNKKVLQ